MKLFLFFLALQIIAVSSKSSSHEWKENIIAENQRQAPSNSAPPGPYCQSLVAYVAGNFQSKNSQAPSFAAQFQVRLDADLKTKRITVDADQWNEKYADSEDFELDFYYASSYEWCSIKEKECSSSFSKNVTDFYLDINNQDVSFYHLLYFSYFNNSFALNQASGTCTKHQLSGINDDRTPDLDAVSICVCCDYYDPDPILGCPADPWKDATPPPIATTVTTPPSSQNITCSAITAYFNGKFANEAYPSKLDVEFDVKMSTSNKGVYYEIDHWNDKKTNPSDITLGFYGSQYQQCDPPIGNNCSVSNPNQDNIILDITHYKNGVFDNQYGFLHFFPFNKQFSLFNAVGQCTNFQPYLDGNLVVNSTLYDFCMCCGDYRPDPSLNCPKNPWA